MREIFLKYEKNIIEEINKINHIYNNKEYSIKNLQVLDEILIRINRVINSVLDLSTEFIEFKKLGVYKKRINVFEILERTHIIDIKLKKSMEELCEGKNINMNNSNEIDSNNINHIINTNLKEVKDFTSNISNNI